MRVPCSEHSIRIASRLSRVSSFLASITQNFEVRRYDGGWEWKKSQAFGFARNR